MVAEVPRVPTWEALAVDLDEGGRCEFPVGAIRDETLVPLLEIANV